jgi:hypothetical protein
MDFLPLFSCLFTSPSAIHGLKHGALHARWAVGDVDDCRCQRLHFEARRVIIAGN